MIKFAPIKHSYQIRDSRCGKIADLPLLSVSVLRGIVPRSDITGNEPRAYDLSNYKLVSAGDIVINRMSAYQGALGLAHQPGIVSPEYIVLRPAKSVDGRYLTYLFKSKWFVSEMALRVRGIGSLEQGNVRTPRINPDDLGLIPVSLPTIEEQIAIADYLDTETTRIDTLISKKQRMVELLLEHAKAKLLECFVQPVTNRSLRAMAEIALGRQRSPQHDSGPFMVRYLRAANVKDGRLALDDVKEMNFSPAEQGRFSLKYGDVLVTEGAGSLEAVGASAVWRDDLPGTVCFQNTLLRLRPSSLVTADFLGWWCRYAYHAGLFADLAGGANIYHLGANGMKTIRCHIPSIGDQGRIVVELEHLFGVNERVIATLEVQISLLGERRQALITAAVTGQLDIPEVAA